MDRDRGTSYMNAELHGSPYERRRVGFNLRVGVHNGRVLLDALEQRAEAAGDAAALARCVGAVELGREGEHLGGARHAAQCHQARLALVTQTSLELGQGRRERIRIAARIDPARKVHHARVSSCPM